MTSGVPASCYGNDDDIYEIGHLNDVYVVNQVKLKDDSSILNQSSIRVEKLS